jgi:hypothetical protein
MPFKDKQKQAAAAARHYEANKDKVKARARKFTRETILENRRRLLSYFQMNQCVDCVEGDPLVLCFDHVGTDTKRGNVSNMVGTGYSWPVILEEIAKCLVRCHNCHARKTAKEQGWHKLLECGETVSNLAHNQKKAGSTPATPTLQCRETVISPVS